MNRCSEKVMHAWHFVFLYTLNCAGGSVVHSYGRFIPHEFPITDLQQISGPDGIGTITCAVSSGRAWFVADGGELETGGVSQIRNGTISTLKVNLSNVSSFQNRGLYCTNIITNFFYLFISSASKWRYYCMQSEIYRAHPADSQGYALMLLSIYNCIITTYAIVCCLKYCTYIRILYDSEIEVLCVCVHAHRCIYTCTCSYVCPCQCVYIQWAPY